ncbi:succinate dehydrogenase assembly factor 2 [Pelagibacterales bacterium]|jgi:antitoxin CptB|nr:succinate dehydrogenase assembly factor 2 [Pelagibacterales bacterium]
MDDIEIHRKKLLFRAGHRGTKEMDILLGNFANKYIQLFDELELVMFSTLLDCEDDLIYKCLLDKESVPPEIDNRIFHLLKDTAIKK